MLQKNHTDKHHNIKDRDNKSRTQIISDHIISLIKMHKILFSMDHKRPKARDWFKFGTTVDSEKMGTQKIKTKHFDHL